VPSKDLIFVCSLGFVHVLAKRFHPGLRHRFSLWVSCQVWKNNVASLGSVPSLGKLRQQHRFRWQSGKRVGSMGFVVALSKVSVVWVS